MARSSDAPSLIIPAVGGLYEAGSNIAYPMVRFFAGIMLVPHGAQKLFEMFGGNFQGTAGFFTKMGLTPAEIWVYAAGTIEFFGGILIAIGLLTRPAALAATVLLLVAAIHVHMLTLPDVFAGKGGYFWTKLGYEYALLWAIIMLSIFFKGGGKMSVDSKLGKEF